MSNRNLAIGAALVVAIGSLLPWASVTTMFGTISVNGTTGGDGKLTLLASLLALALLVIQDEDRKWGPRVAAWMLWGCLLVSMIDFPREGDGVSAGIGLYLVGLGGLIGGFAAWNAQEKVTS